MSKPKFDPNKAYEVAATPKEEPKKSGFDPNKPFETPEENPRLTGLKLLERGLSIPGATGRAVVLGGLERLSNYLQDRKIEEPSWQSEIFSGLKGEAPPTKEYLERAGVSDLGSISIPGGKSYGKGGSVTTEPKTITGREAIGAVGDIGSDVLSGQALGRLMKVGGKGLFKSAFSRGDKALQLEGKAPVSEIFWERGKTPLSSDAIHETTQKMIPEIAAERGVIEAPILASTERGSMSSALNDAQKFVDELKISGSATDRELAVGLQRDLDKQLLLGEQAAIPPSIQQVQSSILGPTGKPMTSSITIPGKPAVPGPTYKELMDVKRGAGESVPWDGKTSTEGSFWKKVGGGARKESYGVAEKVKPGSSKQIAKKNEQLSTLLSFTPEAERKALVEAGRAGVTQIDTLLAATNPQLYAAKNFGRFIGSTGFRTAGGRTGYGLGVATETLSPASSLWLEMMRRENKNGR